MDGLTEIAIFFAGFFGGLGAFFGGLGAFFAGIGALWAVSFWRSRT
jgi:hypothetical protein